MNQATEFNKQIEDMIDDVEAAIQQGSNEEEQQAIAAKREEVLKNFTKIDKKYFFGFRKFFLFGKFFGG